MRFGLVRCGIQTTRMSNIQAENLFRRQAIQSLRSKSPGRPICLMPRSWAWLNGLVISLFIAIAVFLGSAEYARKESVRGWLVSRPGVVRISHHRPVLILEVAREAGDKVRVGDPLVYFSTDSMLPAGYSKNEQVLAQLREEMQELDAQLDLSEQRQHLDSRNFRSQQQDFDAELRSLLARVAAQERRIELSDDKLRRLKSAASDGAASDLEVLQQRQNLNVLEQELSSLQQSTAGKRRERKLLTSRQQSLPVQSEIDRSTLRAQRLQLSGQITEIESKRLSVLNSPIAGTVASVEVRAGSTVAMQQLMMTILPADMQLAAEVYVPSRAAGFVRPGQVVRLAYDAFPQQKFGTFDGLIAHVSDFVLLPSEIPQTFPVREATYKVQVEIRDTEIITGLGVAGLRPGMLLVAEIVLERRNLIDWLLEPLRLRRNTAV